MAQVGGSQVITEEYLIKKAENWKIWYKSRKLCIFSVTWFSEYNTLTVTKHFEKVVYIHNKSAFEQRENCILKA